MRRSLLTALVLGFLSACSGGDATGPDTDPNAHVGSYSLVSINGNVLPAVFDTEGFHFVYLSGQVTLKADGTSTNSYTFTVTQGGNVVQQTDNDTGTYARAGTTISVVWASGDRESYSFSGGNTLTINETGAVVVFRK
jgi:hypothetical protein